jgi:membrane protease YdiL (CAAX protease family)
MVAIAIAASVGLLGAAAPAITVAVAGGLVVEFVRVLFLGGPLEEELGWRGFLLPRLQAKRAAFDASVLLGVIWGLWHVPLYFVLGTGQHATAAGAGAAAAIIAFVVWTIALSILFTWLFNQTRGSLIVVILFHASVNLAAFVPAALASAGAATFLYPLATWIVALIVAARYGREDLALHSRIRISTLSVKRDLPDPRPAR